MFENIFSYLSIVFHEEMLIFVVNDLHKFVANAFEPEEWRNIVKVCQFVMKMGNGVVTDTDVGTDAVGSKIKIRTINLFHLDFNTTL